MHRFFLPKELFLKKEFVIPKDTSRQLCQVLRLKSGDTIVGLDNAGKQYLLELVEVSNEKVIASVIKEENSTGEPNLRLSLFISLAQREKFELVLQKATEIGVSTFFPMICRYSLVRKEKLPSARRLRWQSILKEAAEQSGRGLIPELCDPQSFESALIQAKQEQTFA